MSNVGTTATTISPAEANPTLPQIEDIKETDMDNALSLFERMANSVVSASKLMPVVQGLMKDVDSLKKDIDHVREMNSRLDEMLTATRKERNELLNELNGVRTELNGAKQTNEQLHFQVEGLTNQKFALQDEIEKAKSEANGWMEAALKADADLQAANAKLAKFQEMFESVFGSPTKIAPPSEPVQLPSWSEAKEVTNRPGGSTYVSGITGLDDTTAPSAEPQPALQTLTEAPKAEPKPDAETVDYEADQRKVSVSESSERYPDLKPWDRYGD